MEKGFDVGKVAGLNTKCYTKYIKCERDYLS